MKRIVSTILALAMLCSMCFTTAFAAEKVSLKATASKTTVQAGENITFTISLEGTTQKRAMAVGFNIEVPDDFEYVSHTIADGLPENATYTSKTGTFGFYAGTKSAPFKLLEVTFKVKDTASFGKRIITFKNDDDLAISDEDDESFDVSLGKQEIVILKAPLTTVSATVKAPVKGTDLATTGTTGNTDAYTVTKVEWFKGTSATGTAVTGKAAAKQIYTAKLTVTAKDAENFAESLNNKKTADGYTIIRVSDTVLTMTKTFPATAEKTLTGITIKTCPHTTYTAGEQFNKAGMVITAAYDDGSTKDVQPTYFQFTPTAPLTVNDKEVTITYTEGNVTQIAKQEITVNPKALTANMVQPIASQPYTGSAIEPTVTVNVGKKTLTAGTDYTVTYKDNTNVGTAKVIVTGKGNYTGSVETKFNITAKALTASMVRDIAAQTYTGSPIVPELTVKDGKTALSKDTDYTVEYQNNLNAGTATVTVTGKGNYSDSVSKTFTIEPKSITPVVTVSGDYTYTGSAITPAYTVEITKGGLKLGDDQYTVEFSDNTNAGTGKIIVKAKDGGNYSFDAVNQTFTIKQKDVTAQRDAANIQVVVDKGTFDEPTFGDVKGTLTYSYDGATSYDYDAIVGKLKTLHLGATGNIEYTYTANENYTGTITGTLHFTVVNLPAATITTAPAAKTGLTFNGTEQVLVNAGSGIIGGTLQYKLDGGSYNAELPKATNAGSYTVYYKVKGNNTTHSDSSEQSFTVTIAPKTVTAAVSVEPTSYTYTGKAIEPTTVTVKDGTTVIPASEYTVTYGNNTNAGKATVTVKDQDGGNYVVSGTATFTITKAELSGVTVSLKGWTYGDTAKTPTVSGNLGGGNVTYQYKADNASTYTSTVPTNAGTYTVKATVAESANYKAATATGSFTIAPKTVTNAAVTLSQTSYAYTGRAFQPSVTVKDGTTVIPASEYTVVYTDNINVGTATVTVSDRAGGNYVVSGTATFTITKAALSGVSVSLGGWTYGDTAKTPTVSGNLGNANVTYQYKAADAADETYTNVVPTNAGTYTVKATVAESANYAAATATRNFTIVPKAISKATVENIGEQEFTGRTITPTVTVKDGTVVLTDADYSVAYANNIDAGTANVTITGKGNYTGSTSVKFTIAQAAAPVVVDDSGATVTAPDTTKENVAVKLDETGKTKYNKDSKGEVTTDEEIILGNVKKAMGVTGTNSTMITAQVTTSGSATKAMTVLPYAQGADSRKNFTVKKLNADGTIETIDSRNVVKMAAGLKLELEDGAIYAISWTTPSSSGSGSSYTSGQSFTTDLPADSINRVTVNGKKLDSKYYTVSSNGSGSIVTLTDAYLATLKAGKYTVKIENKTHVSTGTFTIKADGTLSSPRTADAGVCLYAAMALMSGTGAAYVTLRRKKEN